MSYSIDLDPLTNTKLRMRLYENVRNTRDLKQDVISGKLQCCIIKPSLVFDPMQVIVAANKALLSPKMTTKTVFTEILFNLNLSHNITQSLQRFGIDEEDTSLLVVTLEKNGQDESNVYEKVIGDELDISELQCVSDIHILKKVYKISDKEFHAVHLLDSILSRIACKDIL